MLKHTCRGTEMPQEMFSYLADKNGNPITQKDFKKMDREFWILVLQKYVKKMTYLHEDDKRALSHIASHLQKSIIEPQHDINVEYDKKYKQTHHHYLDEK